MKQKTESNGSKNNDWETPEYIYKAIKQIFGYDKKDLFDPCPLKANFNGLNMIWADVNYVNPPYDQKGKEAFIMKAYEEFKKGKITIMLIPASTETKIFHNIIVPNASVYLILLFSSYDFLFYFFMFFV